MSDVRFSTATVTRFYLRGRLIAHRVRQNVSEYIRGRFAFVVVPVDQKAERLSLESKMISTLSLCAGCGPSPQWLGLFSTKKRIRASGLWLVNELYKEPLSVEGLERLTRATATSSVSIAYTRLLS
jgi:hypothetical protein